MAYDVLAIIAFVLATARITRLVTADRITSGIRIWFERWPLLAYLVTCDWCVSMYVAPLMAWGAWEFAGEPWWLVIAGGLSASYVTGWLGILEPETSEQPAGEHKA